MISRIAVALCLCVFLTLAALGQAPTGEITGTVTDATGAVLAGAAITATNQATNLTRSAMSNDSGLYALPALPPGTYNLKIELQGFQTVVRNNVELQVAQIARLDFTMNVGSVTEVVEVTGSAPVLDTETTNWAP